LSFELRYHTEVRTVDIPRLDASFKESIRRAIETRLVTAPHRYGKPLKRNLKGYWKLRVGDYRVVFRIVEEDVWILAIIH